MDMDIKNHGFTSIEQVTGQYLNRVPRSNVTAGETSFRDVLIQKVNENTRSSELKFSKHASQRLMDRNINLSEEQLNRLEKGAMLSSQKGIKESLVLMDELAFIINTGNNTVVTAMQKGNEGENIYTNIDGAVLV